METHLGGKGPCESASASNFGMSGELVFLNDEGERDCVSGRREMRQQNDTSNPCRLRSVFRFITQPRCPAAADAEVATKAIPRNEGDLTKVMSGVQDLDMEGRGCASR